MLPKYEKTRDAHAGNGNELAAANLQKFHDYFAGRETTVALDSEKDVPGKAGKGEDVRVGVEFEIGGSILEAAMPLEKPKLEAIERSKLEKALDFAATGRIDLTIEPFELAEKRRERSHWRFDGSGNRRKARKTRQGRPRRR